MQGYGGVENCPRMSGDPDLSETDTSDIIKSDEKESDQQTIDGEESEDSLNHCTEAAKVLARFCVEAPKVEIRDCIRQYSESKSYKQQTSSFNAYCKTVIIETLEFLGADHKIWNNEKKSTCVHELIYRIQSLLPETCAICKDSYTILKDDPRYLSCSVCKQEVHRECYMPLLKVCDKNLADTIFNIPGIHFLCPSCEYDHIPDDAAGLKRKKIIDSQNVLSESTNTEIRNVGEIAPANTKKDEPRKRLKSNLTIAQQGGDISNAKKVSFNPNPHVSNNTNSIKSISHQKKQAHVEPKVCVENEEKRNNSSPHTKVCNEYIKNCCKFGMKGNGCPFSHPKRCTKLMNFGTKTDKGCNLGKKCKDFHPKMCPMSMAKGECYDVRCQLCHVKGTKRWKPKEKVIVEKKAKGMPTRQDRRSETRSESNDTTGSQSLHQSFLEQIRLLKKEIQEAMDLKLSALLLPAPPPPPNPQVSYQHLYPSKTMTLPQQHQHQQVPMLQLQMPHPHPMQMWYPTYTYPQAPVQQLCQPHLAPTA